MNKAYQYYKDLPSWAKGVVVIGVLGVAYIVGNKIYKAIKGNPDDKNQKKTLQKELEEKKNLQNMGMRLSYQASQYRTWADSIETEFAGCDPRNKSFDMFKQIVSYLKNDLDYLELSTAFEIREYDECGYNPFNNWGNFRGNLVKAVNEEFSPSERATLNQMMRQKGITYSFS